MWYAYALYPIDHQWEFLTPLKTLATEIGTSESLERVMHGDIIGYDGISSEVLAKDWIRAKSLARAVGWEGDITAGPSLFWLPTDNQFEYGFAFKQQNNGMSFIISPVRLAWLEDLAAYKADSLNINFD